ncbi:MAG: hypothetical protein ACYDDV_02630 [Methanoregula sp.]
MTLEFIIAQLSFIKSKQTKFETTSPLEKPIEILENRMKEKERYIPRRMKKGKIGLYFGDFLFDENKQLMSIKLGRTRKTQTPKFQGGKFLDQIEDTFPHVFLLWDRKEQAILIERKISIFFDYEIVLKSLEDHFNDLISDLDVSVFLEPKSDTADFWKIIEENDYIYEVGFTLHMPNLFGNLQKPLKETLEGLQKKYNNTDVTTQITNPEGNLNLNKSDPDINENLAWIAKGGGSWAARVTKLINKRRDKKVKITSVSDKFLKIYSTTIEIENYSPSEIKSILKDLKPAYSIMEPSNDVTKK